MSKQTLLVFPSTVDSAVAFARTARALDFKIVGASSVHSPPVLQGLDAHFYLPFITETAFENDFLDALKKYGITHVYAPHHAVWWRIQNIQKAQKFAFFSLCAPHPFDEYWNDFVPSLRWAENQAEEVITQALPQPSQGLRAPLTVSQLAGLHRCFLHTPGESDDEKLAGLCSIARLCPVGDVVEIGSLFGRSAQAMAWMASYYGIGSTICVDPWKLANGNNQGMAAALLNIEAQSQDFDKIFSHFLATAATTRGLSYIRAPSEQAIDIYARAIQIGRYQAEGLDPVSLQGRIALLHIDGNHRYDHVCADIRDWAPYLADYGWLMLDDYIWSFGSGPQQAGDELLTTGNYDYAFVLSDTLFLRRKPTHLHGC